MQFGVTDGRQCKESVTVTVEYAVIIISIVFVIIKYYYAASQH